MIMYEPSRGGGRGRRSGDRPGRDSCSKWYLRGVNDDLDLERTPCVRIQETLALAKEAEVIPGDAKGEGFRIWRWRESMGMIGPSAEVMYR